MSENVSETMSEPSMSATTVGRKPHKLACLSRVAPAHAPREVRQGWVPLLLEGSRGHSPLAVCDVRHRQQLPGPSRTHPRIDY
jgi:hypothetical protein